MLNYKTLYGDLLVFKNQNDCMTINRGILGRVDVDAVEINGENLELEDCDYDFFKHPNNTFTQEETDYFIENYAQIVGDRY